MRQGTCAVWRRFSASMQRTASMTYGPGYVLWKQILREREERRAERLEARRGKQPPVEPPEKPAPSPKRPARGRRAGTDTTARAR